MTDDELLAAVLRRFFTDAGVYVSPVHTGTLLIDGDVELTEAEQVVLQRLYERRESAFEGDET